MSVSTFYFDCADDGSAIWAEEQALRMFKEVLERRTRGISSEGSEEKTKEIRFAALRFLLDTIKTAEIYHTGITAGVPVSRTFTPDMGSKPLAAGNSVGTIDEMALLIEGVLLSTGYYRETEAIPAEVQQKDTLVVASILASMGWRQIERNPLSALVPAEVREPEEAKFEKARTEMMRKVFSMKTAEAVIGAFKSMSDRTTDPQKYSFGAQLKEATEIEDLEAILKDLEKQFGGSRSGPGLAG